jgi:PAS domain S-box-containing protein
VVGGAGALVGTIVVVQSGLTGVIFYYLREKHEFWERWVGILLTGYIVHIPMLLLQLLLPENMGVQVLTTVGPIVLMFFPIGQLLIISIFVNRRHAMENQRMLNEQGMWYQRMFEDSIVPRLVIDPDTGAISDVNPAAIHFYGYSREEFLGLRIDDISMQPPEQIAENFDQVISLRNTTFEINHKTKQGKPMSVTIFSSPVISQGKTLLNTIIIDTSKLKELERETYILSECVENAAIGVFRIAEDTGRILWANQEGCRRLGYSREELQDMYVFDIDTHLDEASWVAHRKQVRTTRTGTIETEHRCKDGSCYPVEITVTYFTYQGETLSFSFAKDITKRKESESRMLETLAQKNLLIQEIHHRVRNNLSLIMGMINLERDHLSANVLFSGIMTRLTDRILAIGLIHDLAYQDENLSEIKLKEFMTQIAEELLVNHQLPNSAKPRITGDEVFLDITKTLPLGLMIAELFSHYYGTVAEEVGSPSAADAQLTISIKRRAVRGLQIAADSDHPLAVQACRRMRDDELSGELMAVLALQGQSEYHWSSLGHLLAITSTGDSDEGTDNTTG